MIIHDGKVSLSFWSWKVSFWCFCSMHTRITVRVKWESYSSLTLFRVQLNANCCEIRADNYNLKNIRTLAMTVINRFSLPMITCCWPLAVISCSKAFNSCFLHISLKFYRFYKKNYRCFLISESNSYFVCWMISLGFCCAFAPSVAWC